jgi:hypothetical protein
VGANHSKIPGTATEPDYLAADYQRSGPDRECERIGHWVRPGYALVSFVSRIDLATESSDAVSLQLGRTSMADNPKDIGKGDRIRASMQKHEVQFIAKKFGISGQAAAGAIRAAGPMREKVYAYIKGKKPQAKINRVGNG